MNVLSLFDGISCARVALERAEMKVDKYYSSEIDKYAIQIAQKNYPDTIQLGDIKHLYYKNFEFVTGDMRYYPTSEIDLMVGGSPCQDLSIAKKNREGLKGCRSGLFYEFVRLLKEIKPKYFVLENVASMPKEAKAEITKQLWGIEPTMINAALVSAQNRKRLFWVGKLKTYYSNKLDNDEQWSEDVYEQVAITQPEDRGILLKDILEYGVSTEKSYCLPATHFKENTKSLEKRKKNGLIVLTKNGEEKMKSNTVRTSGKGSGINDKHNWDTIRIGQIGKGGQGDRIYSPEGKSVNLSTNGGGRGAKTGLYLIKAPNGKDMEVDLTKTPHLFKEVRTEEGKKSRREIRKLTGRDTTKRGKNDKKYIPQDSGKANCITTGLGVEGLLAENTIIRKLTPIECERLQSLPDRYTEGISNSQRYKCLGNGMNCEVIRHILSFINK